MSKHMYQVDGVIPCVTCNMSRKQYERHITDIVIDLGVRVLQLHRWFSVTKEDAWGIVWCTQAFLQFLHENLAYDHVIFIPEPCWKYNSNSICFSLHIPKCNNCKLKNLKQTKNLHRLIVSIMYYSPLLTFCSQFLKIEIFFKYWSKTIALQQSNFFHYFWPLFRNIFQVNQNWNIITILRFDQVRTVFPFQQFICTMFLQFLIKFKWYTYL